MQLFLLNKPGKDFVKIQIWLNTFGGQNVSKKIPKYVKLDLVWWSTFLIIYNGVSMMFLQDVSIPDSTKMKFHPVFP
jgi:hypothetical protein